MDIDIPDFVKNEDGWLYSGSVATHGANAAKQTWSNALKQAASKPLLTTEEQLQALRDHVQAMGFGEDVQSYDADQCNALFIQLISGDMREAQMDDYDLTGEDEDIAFDWGEYYERVSEGQISGNIFRGDVEGSEGFGRIFYTLSN
jgi:hypothetical protein